MIKTTVIVFLSMYLLLSCTAQNELDYPGHYKTTKSSSFAAGDTLIVEYFFEFSNLKIGSSESAVSLFTFLSKHPEYNFVIISHTDSRGSEEANQTLSSKRAEIIRNEMVELGFPAHRLTAIGKGESQPIIDPEMIAQMETKEEMENAHQVNRRTELVLLNRN